MLEDSHTGILTTLRADGSPITLPIWFVALDRTICFYTPIRTKKIARIRNDPRSSFLVESGKRWAELRAVHLSGRIERVEDEAEIDRITAAMDAKYDSYRTAKAEQSETTQQYYASRKYFKLIPGSRILTWDNSRIV